MDDADRIRANVHSQFAVMRPIDLATDLLRVMAHYLDELQPHTMHDLQFEFSGDDDEVNAVAYLTIDGIEAQEHDRLGGGPMDEANGPPLEVVTSSPPARFSEAELAQIRSQTCNVYSVTRPDDELSELLRFLADDLDALPPHRLSDITFTFDVRDVTARVYLSFQEPLRSSNGGARHER